MLKKFRILSVFIVIWSVHAQASLHTIAISAKDFCAGSSLIIITCNADGLEQVSGYVPFQEGKKEYSQEDISQKEVSLVSIQDQSQVIVSDIQHDQSALYDEAVIYLYFNVDSDVDVIRVLLIKNNILVENPFDVIEIPSSQFSLDDEEEDEWDDFGLTDLPTVNTEKVVQAVALSYYDTLMLLTYVAMAYGQAQVDQIYNSILTWFKSKYAE